MSARDATGVLTDASLALGPIPEVGFVLQCAGVGAAFGAIWAARSFERTHDADRRWLIATRWGTVGFLVGIAGVVTHATLGVP